MLTPAGQDVEMKDVTKIDSIVAEEQKKDPDVLTLEGTRYSRQSFIPLYYHIFILSFV